MINKTAVYFLHLEHGAQMFDEKNIYSREDNLLKNAPHTMMMVTKEKWKHFYSRQVAAFSLQYVKKNKFWHSVARVDKAFGDCNLFCTCPTINNV